MNRGSTFQVSQETQTQDAAKAAAAKVSALKVAYKAVHAAWKNAAEDFIPGVLNEEEIAWAAEDPDLAKLLAMCSQQELESMRELRAYKAAV